MRKISVFFVQLLLKYISLNYQGRPLIEESKNLGIWTDSKQQHTWEKPCFMTFRS